MIRSTPFPMLRPLSFKNLKLHRFASLGLLFVFALSAANAAQAAPPPAQPTDPTHPGSAGASADRNTVGRETATFNGRTVELFYPVELAAKTRVPVIIFGHGQALGVKNYQATFEHLARRGVAVIHPQFDTGFFDRDFRRMGQDFANLAQAAMNKWSARLDANRVVFSGHSKGAYIALNAMGLPTPGMVKPRAAVLFAVVEYDADWIRNVDPNIPVTLAVGDQDTTTPYAKQKAIYDLLPSLKKQLITVGSYTTTQPALEAGHFLACTVSLFGSAQVNAFQYFGVWKWLLGAVWDLDAAQSATNPWLYGALAPTTGLDGADGSGGMSHKIERNWTRRY